MELLETKERLVQLMDYLDYMDEIYEELVSEFGHEIESECIHE
jgi:hypothetical protein